MMHGLHKFAEMIESTLDAIEGEDNPVKARNLLLSGLAGNSPEDDRYKFKVGDIVVALSNCGGSPRGAIGMVMFRRNAYPEPFFTGYWFPTYFIDHIDKSPYGGDAGEGCLRLATDDEIMALMYQSEYY